MTRLLLDQNLSFKICKGIKDIFLETKSVLNGFPPKIIWLRIGNSSTDSIIQILKSNHLIIKDFLLSTENAYLEIN